ncbi:reverse transcriptase domain-containing protein [Campylobacter sp.]|uniref:reverse transcriptase domain-containing protein n=1 Tax=Campylobacter sp. TaxID=205 RepID=UPI002A819155|nr:reverse transcriptase domain-containing protein [Campylobacter sp.]MDY4803688.1 reverse transcriptase domain-containing protein [Campylobacter sp.]
MNSKSYENNNEILHILKDYRIHYKLSLIQYWAFFAKDKYRVFRIPKKTGGFREIYAPHETLKNILRKFNKYFVSKYNCFYSSSGENYSPAHGFMRNRSVATNAEKHKYKRYVLNIDLENFFPSISQARVWRMLQCRPFYLSARTANLLASLLCYQESKNTIRDQIFDFFLRDKQNKQNNFLPQGAPTSPMISNFICRKLDYKLGKLAENYEANYTRYADDITFSFDDYKLNNNDKFFQKIKQIIEEENFKINYKKVRMQNYKIRQMVTGLVVNKKINVTRKFIKDLRALLFMIENYGLDSAKSYFAKLNQDKDILKVIQGKLSYLKMVKGSNDSTYIKLFERYSSIIGAI